MLKGIKRPRTKDPRKTGLTKRAKQFEKPKDVWEKLSTICPIGSRTPKKPKEEEL